MDTPIYNKMKRKQIEDRILRTHQKGIVPRPVKDQSLIFPEKSRTSLQVMWDNFKYLFKVD